ncbi:sensor histidine kinase [Roseateles sp. SL47]|uniref:sensor histidine kinase n=1 Tax=Roseateles sp. SL47 TaxID=2995138 RepID=UPI00226FF8CD|nr:sensor histidine kinase [Roseateles sp. SL47]WAC73711.1 sensor histidine kinase [Roseateles sp. SL47]
MTRGEGRLTAKGRPGAVVERGPWEARFEAMFGLLFHSLLHWLLHSLFGSGIRSPWSMRLGVLPGTLAGAFFLLLALPTRAQAILELDPHQPQIDLTPYVALHVDPQGDQGLGAVLTAQDFKAAKRKDLQPSYSPSAYWLRIRLHNRSPEPLRRELRVPPARLEQITLFTHAEGMGWRRSDAGTAVPFSQRDLPHRVSTFTVELEPGEHVELLLRVASRSSINLRPQLWEPAALALRQQRELLADGLMLGMMCLLLLLALALGALLRERAYVYTALYVLSYMLYECGMRGTSFMLLWPNATDWALRSLSTFAILSTLLQVLALSRMLKLSTTQPRLQRTLRILALANVLGISVCLWGNYPLGTFITAQFNTVILLTMLVATWRAWQARHPLAKPWMGMLVAGMMGMAPRYAELLGLLPYSALSDYAPPIASLLGTLLVLGGLLRRMQRQKARQELRLELAVRERTLALDEARQRAERSDQAKGRLLGYLGHDLRAPLASMVQVARQLKPDADFEASRHAIEHSSLLALEMIDEMQHFSRAPESEARLVILPAPLYLHGLLQEIVTQSQALARAGGNTLTLVIHHELPAVVQLDARRLRQVLVNLLANAAKFTRGGRIVLQAGLSAEGQLALAVKDNGPGIAEADLGRVFEPFVRGASEGFRPGIGLGLSIVQQLVQAMEGEIAVHSRPGHGARFEVRLPWMTAQEQEVLWPPARPWLAQPMGEGQVALLLDRCDTVRDSLRERLVLAGFECLEARTPQEADALLREQAVRLLVAEPELTEDMPTWLAQWHRQPGLALLLCSQWHTVRRGGPPRLLKPAPESDWWLTLTGLLRHEEAMS